MYTVAHSLATNRHQMMKGSNSKSGNHSHAAAIFSAKSSRSIHLKGTNNYGT